MNPLTAENVPDLFARNERVVTIFDTELGPMALVLVGATIVASIRDRLGWHCDPTYRQRCIPLDLSNHRASSRDFRKGAEMGRFKLGSTVILAFQAGQIEFTDKQYPTAVTRMGEPFAEIVSKD